MAEEGRLFFFSAFCPGFRPKLCWKLCPLVPCKCKLLPCQLSLIVGLLNIPWLIYLARSRSTTRLPKQVVPWDITLVLNTLTKEPFEPLEGATLQWCTLTITFLLVVTSGRRILDLEFFSCKHPFFESPGGQHYYKTRSPIPAQRIYLFSQVTRSNSTKFL